MSMKIAAMRLFVVEMAAVRVFYPQQLGLTPVSLVGAVAIFDGGPLLIGELADAEAQAEWRVGLFAGVSLETSDIAALPAKLAEAGCHIVGPPERQPWGGVLMHVK